MIYQFSVNQHQEKQDEENMRLVLVVLKHLTPLFWRLSIHTVMEYYLSVGVEITAIVHTEVRGVFGLFIHAPVYSVFERQ